MELRTVQQRAWDNKIAKGFNTSNVPLEFCLLMSEVAEAFDAWRKSPARLADELADVAIFLAGLSEMAGVDLDGAVQVKLAVNEARAYVELPNGTHVKADDE